MSVYKRRGSWFCDITIDGRRVQRVLKKARTRAQAIKAESVIQSKLLEAARTPPPPTKAANPRQR